MKVLLLDKKYFDLNSSLSEGLISSLLKLSARGFRISVDDPESNVDKSILEILAKENIEIIPCDNNLPMANISQDSNDHSSVQTAIDNFLKISRSSSIQRNTKETEISISVVLEGSGIANIHTGIGFFDHMLEQIARHGNIDLDVSVKGDLHVDEHHTVEDVGIVLGTALLNALGDRKGIKRYGYLLPMDDTIAQCAIDLGGRSYLNFKCKFKREKVGKFPTELTEEFFRGLASGLKANIFLKAKGKNDHHKIEALFKSFAKSLNEACRLDERSINLLPSTKGML